MPDLEAIKKRFRSVREPIASGLTDAELLQPGEEKVGTGYNNLIQSDGRVEINNEDRAIGMQMAVGESHLKMGGQMSTDMGIEKTSHDGRFFNPQLKHRGTNLVSHFSPVMKTPPTFQTRLLRGALGVIMGVIQTLRNREGSDAG